MHLCLQMLERAEASDHQGHTFVPQVPLTLPFPNIQEEVLPPHFQVLKV